MENSTAYEQPAAATPSASLPQPLPEEDDRAARDRWRRVGLGLGEVVEGRVGALLGAPDTGAKTPPAEDALIRKICALVIAAQRAMELEDSYEKRARGVGDAKPVSAEAARKLLDLSEREIDEFIRTRNAARDCAAADAQLA